MYPYLDFFNEPENQEMEYADDPEAGDQDLRFHLNAHTGSDRAHPAEPPPQEPVNIIHEGTPQYYPPPYQFQPGIYPQPAYFLVPGVSPNPVNPELRRVQSERRPSAPYPDPPGPSRGPQQPEQNRVKARSTIPLRERAHLTDCGLQLGNDWGCGKKAVGLAIRLFPVIARTQKAAAPARLCHSGLRKCGATLSTMINICSKELLGTTMEAYLDDMLVEARIGLNHCHDLRACFEIHAAS
nr:aldehyde oxidase GLOX1-like [Ipomoea batatas]